MVRRRKIRVISFITAVTVSLSLWGFSSQRTLKAYSLQTDTLRRRALSGLCENFGEMDTCLRKCLYADSEELTGQLARKLSAETAAAKTNLSLLNTGDRPLSGIYKYLSQVSAYMQALSDKTGRAEAITPEDKANLEKLQSYAAALYSRFAYMNELTEAGSLSFDLLEEQLSDAENESADTVSFLSFTGEAEDAMEDYPTLIYDGPFSDNILNKESTLLKNAVEISRNTATKKAAAVLGTEEKYIADEGESAGKLAAYLCKYDNKTVAVTKNGGYISYILSDNFSGSEKITVSDATELASVFLNTCGYTDMQATYQEIYNGVCTVNFAYMQAGYICYPDLIKVSVDMSDGDITALDASDFLMNHIDREIPEEKITPEAAAETVSGNLSVQKIYRAVIPTDTGKEKFTFELLCENKNGEAVLIYTDTVTGEEDDILLLITGNNGTLTK